MLNDCRKAACFRTHACSAAFSGSACAFASTYPKTLVPATEKAKETKGKKTGRRPAPCGGGREGHPESNGKQEGPAKQGTAWGKRPLSQRALDRRHRRQPCCRTTVPSRRERSLDRNVDLRRGRTRGTTAGREGGKAGEPAPGADLRRGERQRHFPEETDHPAACGKAPLGREPSLAMRRFGERGAVCPGWVVAPIGSIHPRTAIDVEDLPGDKGG